MHFVFVKVEVGCGASTVPGFIGGGDISDKVRICIIEIRSKGLRGSFYISYSFNKHE